MANRILPTSITSKRFTKTFLPSNSYATAWFLVFWEFLQLVGASHRAKADRGIKIVGPQIPINQYYSYTLANGVNFIFPGTLDPSFRSG